MLACREPRFPEADSMIRAGRGHWYGAFAGGELARFQVVGTHLDFRRQGRCASLTHFAGEHARRTLGARQLVIVADEHSFAGDLCASVGFVPRCQQLLRMPP